MVEKIQEALRPLLETSDYLKERSWLIDAILDVISNADEDVLRTTSEDLRMALGQDSVEEHGHTETGVHLPGTLTVDASAVIEQLEARMQQAVADFTSAVADSDLDYTDD